MNIFREIKLTNNTAMIQKKNSAPPIKKKLYLLCLSRDFY